MRGSEPVRMSSDEDKVACPRGTRRWECRIAVRGAFFAAADSIHSDGDHSHVPKTVLDKPGTSRVMVVAATESDGDMGRVLLDAADRYSRDPGVNAALRKAVESLHSDDECRAVMSKITQSRGSI